MEFYRAIGQNNAETTRYVQGETEEERGYETRGQVREDEWMKILRKG